MAQKGVCGDLAVEVHSNLVTRRETILITVLDIEAAATEEGTARARSLHIKFSVVQDNQT